MGVEGMGIYSLHYFFWSSGEESECWCETTLHKVGVKTRDGEAKRDQNRGKVVTLPHHLSYCVQTWSGWKIRPLE